MKIGIIGGGQLARMLGLSAIPMGMECIAIEKKSPCSASVSCEIIPAAYDDVNALQQLLQQCDVVTFENENIDLSVIQSLQSLEKISPNLESIAIAQDRLLEKQTLNDIGIPTATFARIDSESDLAQACKQRGIPAILKTRRFGYDGKGQFLIRSEQDICKAWQSLGGVPLILESFVEFDCEYSIIAARNHQGDMVFYPLTLNQHCAGILQRSTVITDQGQLEQQAKRYVEKLLSKLNYVGVLALEMFACGNKLIANEMAPRVHNSGHWTIEGASCSQFENHLRAICGLPLGTTQAIGHSHMINCIGEMPDQNNILSIPYCHYHDYQKAAQRGRKVGHITVHTNTSKDALTSASKVRQLLQ